MRNRAAKFGPAMIASFLATAAFIPMSYGETPAADECLSAPKAETPAGGHWRFRIEHPSNRHCWYLRTEGGSAVKTAAAKPPALTKPAASNVAGSADLPDSVADARAELAGPQSRLSQDTGPAAGQTPATMGIADNAAPAADAQAAISQAAISRPVGSQALTPADAAISGSVVASRWPDQTADAAEPAASPAAPDQIVADATPSVITAQPTGKNNVRVAVADAAADAPLEKPHASTQMMLIVMIGAFSVAGLVASAVGLGGRRKKRVRLDQAGRRANWDAGRPAQQRPSRFPTPVQSRAGSPSIAMAAQRPNIGLPLELRESEELDWPEIEHVDEPEHDEARQHDAKVVDMLSRLARSAQV
jgi:hypothetical protein